ncbi:MAG: type I-B CRISPR-associated protein Cas8b1/Cst1 [Spirochaetota bacterium]
MKYRVDAKDWYYNAGIIGFLNVLSGGEKNIGRIATNFNDSLTISENFIEFDTSVLEGFYEKYEKLSFIKFFDIDTYKERVNKLLQKIEQVENNKKISKKLIQDVALSGKIINAFIKLINNNESIEEIFDNSRSREDILEKVKNIKNKIESYNSSEDLYDSIKNNREFISYYLTYEIKKRICSYESVQDYIKKINDGISEETNINKKCFCCLSYKKECDFSNAITQIVGFNSDNSNWIWGFYDSKVKICPLCALIYSCALHGMIFLRKNIKGEQKTFFYFLNRNVNIETMYTSFWIFHEKIKNKENQNKPFYTIVKEVTFELIRENAVAVLENINFLEIAENEFGGQSTKSYNIYNFNITPLLALFIQSLDEDKIPKGGYYIDKEQYKDLTEEILQKTLDMTLGYQDLASYFDYFLRQKARFSIDKVLKYILNYLAHIKGGDSMEKETKAKIVDKGFWNGITLAKKIDQENKIKGIAYQLLNDLKIGNREAFIDKYLRLSMSYNSPITLGSNNELTDIDNFMSFGYAFVNGLLSNIYKENEEVKNG